MRTCMLAYSFHETDNRIRRYAEALVSRGDRVDSFALRHPGQASFEQIRGVNVFRIQDRIRNETTPISYLLKLLAFFLRSAWKITLHHLRCPYDVIHVHSVPDFLVFAALVPRIMGARVVLDIHDIVPEFYACKFGVSGNSIVFRLLVIVERMSTHFADHVIIANHLWYDKLVRRSVSSTHCTAIINYPDPGLFSALNTRQANERSDFLLCYPGSLNRHQGVEVAVEAVALLRDQAPDIRFLIVGDGPEREKLEVLLAKHDIENRVTLVGAVPMEEIAHILLDVDLGVVPKRKDSFGNEAFSTKILEFMAMGVPVVVADTEIDRYYFSDQLVEFFESNNIPDLAMHILKLKQDVGRRESLRQHGLEFVRKNNWDVKRFEYFELLERLICRDRKRVTLTTGLPWSHSIETSTAARISGPGEKDES